MTDSFWKLCQDARLLYNTPPPLPAGVGRGKNKKGSQISPHSTNSEQSGGGLSRLSGDEERAVSSDTPISPGLDPLAALAARHRRESQTKKTAEHHR